MTSAATSGIPILILAAGRSSRMGGRDKLAEPVGGVPLLRRLASASLAVGGSVIVALPRVDHSRAALLEGLTVNIIGVPESEEGMGGTLRGAVPRLPGAGPLLLLLGDLPEIGPREIEAVLAAPRRDARAAIWRGATKDGAPGHPILFDGALRAEFAELSGDDGGRSIVSRHRVELVPLPGRSARRDLDTPEDWAAFRAETGL